MIGKDSDYIITEGPSQYFNNQVYFYNDLILTTNNLRAAKDIADRINTAFKRMTENQKHETNDTTK